MIENSEILVTGGGGFLGRHVVNNLLERGVPKEKITIPRSKTTNLTDLDNCKKVVKDKDIVIHIAGRIGGIAFNQKYPAEIFYENAIMGLQLIEAARNADVKKFVIIGTTCSFPKFAPIPFKEEDIWNGYPAEETAPYGIAKKMLIVQAQTYKEQYGFNAISLIPTNLYGKYDNFGSEHSHVIPALIERIYKAKINNMKEVAIWGTGKATREFLYAEDAAEGIILATEKYNKTDPVNLGTGVETSIVDIVNVISKIIGFDGGIRWDSNRPDGTPRRCLDVRKAYKEFGFEAKTDLEAGLRKTIEWYKSTI